MEKVLEPIESVKAPLRIFTWHIHGSYLYYLSQGGFELYIPVREDRTEGYYGRGETFPFGANVHEVAIVIYRLFSSRPLFFSSRLRVCKPNMMVIAAINAPWMMASTK